MLAQCPLSRKVPIRSDACSNIGLPAIVVVRLRCVRVVEGGLLPLATPLRAPFNPPQQLFDPHFRLFTGKHLTTSLVHITIPYDYQSTCCVHSPACPACSALPGEPRATFPDRIRKIPTASDRAHFPTMYFSSCSPYWRLSTDLPDPLGVFAHYSSKSFRYNTYGSTRKCCKQKTYGLP